MNKNDRRQFYFSLFRIIALLRGGDVRRSEGNGLEALLVCLMIYAIHYFFFATLFIPSHLNLWLKALFLVVLVFWVWLFWLLLLYVNSLIIKVLHVFGFFRALPIRRAQSILWGISTTAMALVLLDKGPSLHEVGAIWLVMVTMNSAAAVVLAFSDAARNPGR